MSVLFDSVFAAALARELDDAWNGRRLESLHFDAEARSVRLGFREDAWVWLLHPREGVLARVPRRTRRRRPERGILDAPLQVGRVEAPLDARRIVVVLDGDDGDIRLAVDLVTNRWNAIVVGGDRVRRALLPGRGPTPLRAGDLWEAPPSERRWAAAPPTREEWADVAAQAEDPDSPAVRGGIAWLSSINESFVFGGGAGPSYERYIGLRDAALTAPPVGWLHPDAGASDGSGDDPGRPYPHALGRPDAERFDSLEGTLRAIADRSARVTAALAKAVEDPEVTELRDALEFRRDRARKKVRALEAELAAGSEAGSVREIGHLLLARKNDIPRGAAHVQLADFSGELMTIELDPQKDAAANAKSYYDRARRLDRAVAKLPAGIARAGHRIAKLEAALERLDAEGPDERLWKLAGRRPGTRPSSGPSRGPGGTSAAARLPYRRYRTTGGLEVRAGRSARDNDELTFHHSAPDDIWMHVREAPGSHVVLRWGRKDQNPPEADIAEAALVAAVLSRARGSRLVPVSWTRRKYVRKPRKAGAGTVTTERTQTVFVAPDRARAERLADEED